MTDKRELANLVFETEMVLEAFVEVFDNWFGQETADELWPLQEEIEVLQKKYVSSKNKIIKTYSGEESIPGKRYTLGADGGKELFDLQQKTNEIKTPKIFITIARRDASNAKITPAKKKILMQFVEFVEEIPEKEPVKDDKKDKE